MIALIKFEEGSGYNYSYFTDIEGLKKGDFVVVPTKFGFSLGIFEKYSKLKNDEKKAKKWIVQKVDLDTYTTNLELGIYEEVE